MVHDLTSHNENGTAITVNEFTEPDILVDC